MKSAPGAPAESAKERLKEATHHQLAYSLAVKLVAADRKWFNKDTIDAETEFHDPFENFNFEAVATVLKTKIPLLNKEELKKLRPAFTHEPLSIVKIFREEKEKTPGTEPTLLEKIRMMEKRINQITDLIHRYSKNKNLAPEMPISEQRELFKKRATDVLK